MGRGWRGGARRWARRARVTRVKILGYGLAIATLVVAWIWLPLAAVFAAVLLLNFVFGERENVPFSRYPMFSTPRTSAWALRYEDASGEQVPIGRLGIDPQRTKKLFATLARDARRNGAQAEDARRLAAEPIAAELERRRPDHGALAEVTVAIVYVEYRLEGDRVEVIRTPLVETAPS